MNEKAHPPANFINCQVTVKRGKEPGTYKVNTAPDVITVTAPDTVINYQIIPDTPEDIVFSGMTVSPPDSNQLSAPSISVDGKLMTLSDVNTTAETLDVVLQFTDADGNKVVHDPQIINAPK